MVEKYFFDKHYFEEYARLSLVEIFPWGRNLICSDKPDLQDEIDDIGIEVTSSSPQEQQKLTAQGIKLFGTHASGQDIKKYGGIIHINPNRVVDSFIPGNGLASTDKVVFEIQLALNKKREKIINYKDFCQMGLYVFCDTVTNAIEDSHIMKRIFAIDYSNFDFVFLQWEDFLITIRQSQNNIFRLNTEQLARIRQQALDCSASKRNQTR